MGRYTKPTDGPGKGIFPFNDIVTATNRAAGSGASNATQIGDIVMFDFAQSDAAVTNNTIGDSASGWANVVPPTTALEGEGIFGIAMEAVADDEDLEVMIYGYADAFVHTTDTTADVALYSRLYLDVSDEANALTADAFAATDNVKFLAILMEAVTNPETPALGKVWFDGVSGMGHSFTET